MMSNATMYPVLRWVDLTHDGSTTELMAHFSDCHCSLTTFEALGDVGTFADMVCLHYDRPDSRGLNLALELKRARPALPITMFTVQHSEELAVWAMRARIWEYVVLPLDADELRRYRSCLAQLCQVRQQGRHQGIDHLPTLPDSIRLTADSHRHQRLAPALRHIEAQYRSNIEQKELAELCKMTPSRFSRLFKEAFGMSYQDYIQHKRMTFAQQRLANSQMPITSIGYAAGFRDPSYFARAFKQFTGCTPSEYRDACQPAARGAVLELEEASRLELLRPPLRSGLPRAG